MLSRDLVSDFMNHNGALTQKQALALGYSKETLRQAAIRKDVNKIKPGLYEINDDYYDSLYINQQRLKQGIYSHESALDLHNLGDYVPHYFFMTFPRGYRHINFQENLIYPHFSNSNNYYKEVTTAKTMFGNTVFVYSMERTILELFEAESPNVEMWKIINNYLDNYGSIEKLKSVGRQLDKEIIVKELFDYVQRATNEIYSA